MNQAMLELKSIGKTYFGRDGARWPLADGLCLTVAAGETVAVLGPSGTGKSTLLKIVAGLEPADAGQVWFDGVDITHLAPERRRFALMFQDFALFAHLNVLDNVAFGLVEQRVSRREARARSMAMLTLFGLAEHARHDVWTLSGGEQQRVALARALITAPRLLLLDEPFSALDTELRQSLREEFSQRIRERAIPALLVTHDEAEARSMAQRGYRLAKGSLERLW
jgi:ABC-type Fe3+/spermidine/putrescine transport system ATPase subunit